MNQIYKREPLLTVIKCALASSCIVFGTILTKNVDHRYLSSVIFSVGILLVIALNLNLISRDVSSGTKVSSCCWL